MLPGIPPSVNEANEPFPMYDELYTGMEMLLYVINGAGITVIAPGGSVARIDRDQYKTAIP